MDNPLKRPAAATSDDRPSTQQKVDTTLGNMGNVSMAIDDSMLDTVPDTFSEARRTAMDAAVFEHNFTGLHIITNMVSLDETQVFDEQYAFMRNVTALARKNPGILKLLEQAEKERSLKAVRNLRILRPLPHCDYREPVPDMDDSPAAILLLRAFQQDYIGESHHILIKTMETYSKHAPDKAYNFSMAVIQSSGMGKSRKADKAAEEVFAIPFNLHGALEHGMSTYPPLDEAVRYYFTPDFSDTDDQLQIKYAAFLCQLFKEITAVLKSWYGEFTPKIWRDYLADGQTSSTAGKNRTLLYEKVVAGAKTLFKSNPGQEQIRSALFGACEDLANIIPVYGQHEETLKLFVYFDEAHVLTSPPRPGDRHMRSAYQNLNVVLSWLNNCPIFFLFLSTSSSLGDLPPPAQTWHPSMHTKMGTDLFPPYAELPFDVFARGMYSRLQAESETGCVTLDQVCQWEEMVRFGRPLWFSHYKNMIPYDQSVISLATEKLTPKYKYSGDRLGEDANTRYAALSCRIMVDFDFMRKDAREWESQLVESYMRVAYAIPGHREFMRAGYPSEPTLAEAAAQLFNKSKGGAIAWKAPEILLQALTAGLLVREKRREMVGRLLFIIAHDLAALGRRLLSDKGPTFHRPIRLLDFLKHLFHEDWHTAVFDARPVSDPDGLILRDAFDDAWIHFSHCALAGDSEAITVDNLWKALVRGCLFQCKNNQASIDMIAMIVFGDPSTTDVKTARKGFLQCQVKNRAAANDVFVSPMAAKPPKGMPVLSVIMELGSHAPPLVETVNYGSPRMRSPSMEGSNTNHYAIVSHGATSKTYSAIPENVDHVYQSILASTKVIDDYPRDDQSHVDALNRMKPAFYGDAGSQDTSWDFV